MRTQIGDVSDTQSETSAWRKSRRLPSVPLDEEPITAAFASRFIKEKFGKSATSTNLASKAGPHLRPSSSLDSSPYLALPSGGYTTGPVSPYSSLSDVANVINSTVAALGKMTPTMPLTVHSSPKNVVTATALGRSPTPPVLPTYIKSLKQQLKDELKTVVQERKRLLDLRERDKKFYRRSETDLQALFDLYSNVPEVSLADKRGILSRKKYSHRRNASDSKLAQFSPITEDIPPGMFKSYEYESLMPNRSLFRGVGQRRPMSSMGFEARYFDVDSRYFNEVDGGLRETLIPNFMENNENDLFLSAAGEMHRKYRRKSEGSLDEVSALGFGIDPYGRSMRSHYYDDVIERRKMYNRGVPRSWHPSPYVSEDEDDQLTREEKAAKVRAEIARRRQHLLAGGG
ncbi:mucin-17-like protein, partial [Dinothrombium tinctorium]